MKLKSMALNHLLKNVKKVYLHMRNSGVNLRRAIGYWVDMDDPYVTLSNPYIESVWNILGTIHEKGLLYKGHRVSPYCPSCQTSLSSHEVAQGYKIVKDLSRYS